MAVGARFNILFDTINFYCKWYIADPTGMCYERIFSQTKVYATVSHYPTTAVVPPFSTTRPPPHGMYKYAHGSDNVQR